MTTTEPMIRMHIRGKNQDLPASVALSLITDEWIGGGDLTYAAVESLRDAAIVYRDKLRDISQLGGVCDIGALAEIDALCGD